MTQIIDYLVDWYDKTLKPVNNMPIMFRGAIMNTTKGIGTTPYIQYSGDNSLLANALNKIMKSNIRPPLRYLYCTLLGIGSVALYFVIVTILAILFPNMFIKR